MGYRASYDAFSYALCINRINATWQCSLCSEDSAKQEGGPISVAKAASPCCCYRFFRSSATGAVWKGNKSGSVFTHMHLLLLPLPMGKGRLLLLTLCMRIWLS